MLGSRSRLVLRIGLLLLATIFLVLMGIHSAWYRSAFSFGFGDQALFHSFGRWLLLGEAFITDFVHFRTPGPYYYYALMQSLLGEEFRVTSFAILLEASVAQTVATFFLTLAATKAILGRASVGMAFLAAMTILFLPPIFQLRTALSGLALAAYLMVHVQERASVKQRWLVVTGVLAGATFWFGQELFLIFCWTVFITEMIVVRAAWSDKIRRIMFLGLGALLVLVPTHFLLFIAGTDPGEFFYYTVYYAFFVQPSGMDTPFPTMSGENLIYYLPFVATVFAASIVALSGRLGEVASVALVAYSAVRLVSALGRSDFLHLVFSISETIVLLFIALALLPQIRFTVSRLVLMICVSLGLGALFWISVLHGSLYLLAAPVVVGILARLGRDGERQVGGQGEPASNRALLVGGLAGFCLVFFAFQPHTGGTVGFIWKAPNLVMQNPVGNVDFTMEGSYEIAEVQREIEERGAESIFSFPIRPLYYAFASSHPTRLTYFEPQTTEEEYQTVMRELDKTPPDLVVKDLDQVGGLSPVLYPLADFITSGFESKRIVVGHNVIEILEPRQEPVEARRLFDRIYALNADRVAVTHGMRERDDGTPVPVVAVNRGEARFRMESGGERYLRLRLHRSSLNAGIVELSREGRAVDRYLVEVSSGLVLLPLPEGTGPIEVLLRGAEGLPVLWENPMLIGSIDIPE